MTESGGREVCEEERDGITRQIGGKESVEKEV